MYRRDRDAIVLRNERKTTPALAAGALALGATALGALAVGAFAIGRLAVGSARVRSLHIDNLHVGNLVDEDDDEDQPGIIRIWRGRTRRDVADAYEAYNYEVGIKPLIEKAMGVQTFREDREDETEFMTISYWEDFDAMAEFTGGEPGEIHHLPRDAEFLIELPESVQVLRLLKSHGVTG